MAGVNDLPLQKVAISGPTLASMMQRFSSAIGDVDGLLFGHVTHLAPTLSDDDAPQTSSDSPELVATITSFICPNSTFSFYDALGRVDSPSLQRLLAAHPDRHRQHLLGWFSARRRTQIRPSMREFSVTHCLSAKSELSSPIENGESLSSLVNFAPCLFLLFATPAQEQLIHTHDYRAYQFCASKKRFDSKSVDIVNIGPAFRVDYGSFTPNSPFPMLNCDLRSSSAMLEDNRSEEGSLGEMKKVAKDQKELDMCAEGYGVASLSRLMGEEATSYTAGLENMYDKMLVKIESLVRQVESNNAKVLQMENYNRKLRYKVAKGGVE
ncbi:BRISC complex subunit Abraxas 2 [Linum grandiflorum]